MGMTNEAEQPLSQKVIKNTFYNFIGKIWGILVGLFLTPFIIHHIGIERYGVWAIVGVITGYFGLLDLGIGSSFIKYIAEFHTKKDTEKINQVINCGITFYSIFAFAVMALACLFINPIFRILKIPAQLYSESLFVFWVSLTIFCVSSIFSISIAIQNGLQRMDICNKIALITSIPNVAGTIFVLTHGYGLRGLIINNGIILIAGGLINVSMAYKILPELSLSCRFLSKKMFGTLFGYGAKLQVARISSAISMQIDKLLITYFLSLSLVTFFQLGFSVIQQAISVVLLFLSALIPAFSEIDAQGARDKLIDGYIRGTKYLALITIPFFIFIMAAAHQIMSIWMGPGYDRSAWVIQILAIGWGTAVISGMRSVVVQAIAKTEIEMKAGLIAAVFNIPLSIILITKFGFLGVAIGTSISLIASAAYGFAKLHQELGLPLGLFNKKPFTYIFVVSIGAGLLVWCLTAASHGLIKPDRISNLAVFTIQASLFSGIYLGLLLRIKPLDSRDLMILIKNDTRFAQRFLDPFRSPNQQIADAS